MTKESLDADAVPAPRRRRKATDTPIAARIASRLPGTEERQDQAFLERLYQSALEAPVVKAVLHKYECARIRRDSISRKLCGGSGYVTVADLARCEAALSDAKQALTQLANRMPILERHPIFVAERTCIWT